MGLACAAAVRGSSGCLSLGRHGGKWGMPRAYFPTPCTYHHHTTRLGENYPTPNTHGLGIHRTGDFGGIGWGLDRFAPALLRARYFTHTATRLPHLRTHTHRLAHAARAAAAARYMASRFAALHFAVCPSHLVHRATSGDTNSKHWRRNPPRGV